MNRKEIDEDTVIIRCCNCRNRLMDMNRMSTTMQSTKCSRCGSVVTIMMKNQKYECTNKRMDECKDDFLRF